MTMQTPETKASRFGWVAVLCWIAVVLDGFDLVVLGALIPTLTGDETPFMTKPEATFVSTISLVGMTLGALMIGALTDRAGRRRAMIWAVAAFSLTTLACAFTQNWWQLSIFRFLAGFGLGGCLPTAIAMVTEFSRGRTGKASTRLMTGYHVGAVATALLGLLLLPVLGWRSMFVAGALPGLALLPLMVRHLPESPAFLLAQGRRAEAERIARDNGLQLEAAAEAAILQDRTTSGALFRAPFLRNSLGIWVTSFMGLLLVYGLNTWLPTLMVEAGYGLSRGLWFLLLMNVGAVLGLLVAGAVGDRIGLKSAAILWFLGSAVLLAALSVKVPVLALYPMVFVTGCFVFSAQVLVYAYTAANHPPAVRATALGMAAGIGRLGAISGPLIGGTLVSLGVGHPWGFYIFAAVGLFAMLAIATTRVMRQKI
ncbi:benzoate transport [Paracoccus aminovorans]|uniref:Benzoate transport n=1 Tax=Paracoccus aminovorans TaxID=34004 RepID=A0A1I3AR83_9RHOB|nr:aromatic acid/H+ symport family MFS transporter [Paracoccus aminovorans]CQR84338.1 major facilitator transporter [Paracoccus aminovorans]SFH52490.1 benzoate transport [Paracoccus aminovorans]